MNQIVETSAASVLTSYLVSLFKLAWPTVPSWALVIAALASGLASALLISLAGGEALTTPVIATNVLQGIGAAAIAAGLTRTDQAAQGKRDVAQAAQADALFVRPVERPEVHV